MMNASFSTSVDAPALRSFAPPPCAAHLIRQPSRFAGGMTTLSALIRQDRFPALQQLLLQGDTNMEDEDAILLAKVLPTHVTYLELRCIGMDDALASIVRTGRFQCLETLC